MNKKNDINRCTLTIPGCQEEEEVYKYKEMYSRSFSINFTPDLKREREGSLTFFQKRKKSKIRSKRKFIILAKLIILYEFYI